jgi:hypothetical protein
MLPVTETMLGYTLLGIGYKATVGFRGYTPLDLSSSGIRRGRSPFVICLLIHREMNGNYQTDPLV